VEPGFSTDYLCSVSRFRTWSQHQANPGQFHRTNPPGTHCGCSGTAAPVSGHYESRSLLCRDRFCGEREACRASIPFPVPLYSSEQHYSLQDKFWTLFPVYKRRRYPLCAGWPASPAPWSRQPSGCAALAAANRSAQQQNPSAQKLETNCRFCPNRGESPLEGGLHRDSPQSTHQPGLHPLASRLWPQPQAGTPRSCALRPTAEEWHCHCAREQKPVTGQDVPFLAASLLNWLFLCKQHSSVWSPALHECSGKHRRVRPNA